MSEHPKNCAAYRTLLEAHLLGDLHPDGQALLKAHEAECAACASEGRSLLRVRERLDALREARAADPAFDEAASRLFKEARTGQEQPLSNSFARRAARSRTRGLGLAATGIAAAGLAIFIAASFFGRQGPTETVPSRTPAAAVAESPGIPLDRPADPSPAPPPLPPPPETAAADAVPRPPEPKLSKDLRASHPEAARPLEEQKPPAPPSRPRETVAVAVLVESVEGKVQVTAEGKRTPPKVGQVVLEGQGIETVGRDSAAVLRRHDGTRLALGPDTAIRRESKAIFVGRGVVQADVVPQSSPEPMTFLTPQAWAEVAGARLTLSVAETSTRVDVDEGRVRLTRTSDGASADVPAGYTAVAAPHAPPVARIQDKKLDGKVDQLKVDAAIDKGARYLKGLNDYGVPRAARKDELVLLTLVHAGVPASDPAYQRLFKAMMEAPLEKTYSVVLQAMILEEVDRVRHQGRIAQCGQFLVDNECRNGQWSYGEPTTFAIEPPRDVATGAKERAEVREFLGPGQKPKVVRKIHVKKQREGPPTGDNSNTQYAALGLRACHDAGIVLPKEWIRLARNWWYVSQHDGSNDAYAGRGWSYREKGDFHPYGSMTAGAVGGVVIYDFILDESWKRDACVHRGMEWVARNFTVTENPGPPEPHGGGLNHYYYLYAMERLGILYGTEKLGAHDWYPKGALFLLDAQRADGSWQADDPVTDTCFAILFLRRATRPIASQDKK